MPEFTGSTDEKHVFTLPSEIDSVRTDRRQVAPRGKFGVKVATIFCADKSFIRLKLIDARGTVCDQISGRLIGDSVNVDLRVPPDAKGALMVRAEMPNHGLSADSEARGRLDSQNRREDPGAGRAVESEGRPARGHCRPYRQCLGRAGRAAGLRAHLLAKRRVRAAGGGDAPAPLGRVRP